MSWRAKGFAAIVGLEFDLALGQVADSRVERWARRHGLRSYAQHATLSSSFFVEKCIRWCKKAKISRRALAEKAKPSSRRSRKILAEEAEEAERSEAERSKQKKKKLVK